MHAYLEKVERLLTTMKKWMLNQISHAENEEADSQAKMASASPMNITKYVHVELLHQPTSPTLRKQRYF